MSCGRSKPSLASTTDRRMARISPWSNVDSEGPRRHRVVGGGRHGSCCLTVSIAKLTSFFAPSHVFLPKIPGSL